MLNSIYNAIVAFTDWAWGLPILVLLIGGGIVLTISNDFIQFKHFGSAMKNTIVAALKGKDKSETGISGFQVVCAALAGTIGTGNVVGVGTAIALGGPGAVFWMWVIGLVAMALKYSEATLAVHTREPDPNGGWRGGPAKYLGDINKGLGILWAFVFIVGVIIASGLHTGSVVGAAQNLGAPPMVATIIVAIIVILIIYGGLKMFVSITEKMVPFMTIAYILCGILIIVINIGNFVPAIISIFASAFTGTAAVGGFSGAALAATIRHGCARGMYSCDGGNGTAAVMHAQADTDSAVKQGMWGVFEVFVDTIIVCSFSALVILVTGVWQTGDPGSVLVINAFASSLGVVGRWIAALSLILFAGSTVMAFCAYVGIQTQNSFGVAARWVAQILFVIMVFVGGTVGVDRMIIWADFANVFQITLNLIGVLILSKTLRKLTLDYFSKENSRS